MKLSIVTINYNNAEGLRRTLASVASQTYRDIEHIIIDGGSADGSLDAIKDYVDANPNKDPFLKHTIKWVSEKDNGIYNAMNKGIEIALGRRVVNSFNRSERSEDKNKVVPDYVQILNSGDILAAPDVTARMVREVEKEEYPAILYGNMMKDKGDGELVRDNCEGTGPIDGFLYFFVSTLNHDCAYIRRDLFDKYGLYNEEMKICSDWEWYVKAIALGGEKAVYTNIDVTVFDMNGVSESGGKNKELMKKERREYLEKTLPASVLRDYDSYTLAIVQYQRLKKHHMWGIVNFMERVLFKLEKWHVLK